MQKFINEYGLHEDVDISVRGVSLTLTKDDRAAYNIEQGFHLVLWNDDVERDLWLDRYDARTLLSSYEEFKKFSEYNLYAMDWDEDLMYERYQDLLDANEDDLDPRKQEEINAINDSKSKIAWTYADSTNELSHEVMDDDNFSVPSYVNLPEGVLPPKSRKHYNIIMHTVKSTRQSAQLEILIKLKQTNNPIFDFLTNESELHPFYEVSSSDKIIIAYYYFFIFFICCKHNMNSI